MEGQVVSSVPVVLPSSKERETGDNVELKRVLGRVHCEGGSRDVTNVITVVDVTGLSGEALSELEDGCWAASWVSLEINSGEVSLIIVINTYLNTITGVITD